MTSDEFTAICDEFMARLAEHADAVQVLATFYDPDGDGCTVFRKRGTGNHYARVGMVREFLMQDSSRTAATEINEVLNPPEDE